MAYVPPALRKRQEAAKGERLDDVEATRHRGPRLQSMSNLPTVLDIQKHYWPTPLLKPLPKVGNDDAAALTQGSTSTPDQGRKLGSHEDVARIGGNNALSDHPADHEACSIHQHSTLNATEASPDRLKYVLLFHDAHPRWEPDKIIYVKSELHLLPKTADNAPAPRRPTATDKEASQSNSQADLSGVDKPLATQIAIFEQESGSFRAQHQAGFRFIGYFNLMNVQILQPNTPELIRMLEQKWTRTNKRGQSRQIARGAASWKKSLGYTWAVLKFEADETATAELGAPDITVAEKDERKGDVPRKGVNEMLKEMRLTDDKPAG